MRVLQTRWNARARQVLAGTTPEVGTNPEAEVYEVGLLPWDLAKDLGLNVRRICIPLFISVTQR